MRMHLPQRWFYSIFVFALVVTSLPLMFPQSVAEGQCNVQHTVQTGDTLFRISLRYGVSMSAIASANNISNINLIYIGQILFIPCSTPDFDGAAVNAVNSNLSQPQSQQNANTNPDCSGFQGTSPDALKAGVTTFYWDAPQSAQPAHYQVHILNAAGANVGSFETVAPNTNLSADSSIANIGDGTQFYWYVVAVLGDSIICQTPSRYAQREWPNPPPADVPVPTATPEIAR